MSFQFVFRDTYVFASTDASIRIPILFHPGFRLAINAKLISGLGESTRSLGLVRQLLFIDGLGDVKGDFFPLSPSFQLLVPTTEFNFRLIYQPVAKRFSVELSIWVDTMPISNPSATPQSFTSSATASTTVTSLATSTAILAANTARKGATVWNASTATLYLDLDAAVTLTDYAVKLDPGGYFEVPFGFTGAISGIWSAVNGNALVREFT